MLIRRVARPSEYVPLSDGAFQPTFDALWSAHVDFGTSRSHKKLLGKKRRAEPLLAADVLGESVAAAPREDAKKRRREERRAERTQAASAESSDNPAANPIVAAGDAAADGLGTGTGAKAATAAPQVLANKGRFAGTLAAKLLGVGG